MKRRILSIITTMALVLPMMCAFNLTAYAANQAQVIKPDGTTTTYWSHQTAWAAAVECGGTFKLLGDWKPSSKDFSTEAVGDEDDYFESGAIYVPEGMSVTIDLNGHNISRNLFYGYNEEVRHGEVIYLDRDASLTIKDTSSAGNGRIEDGNSSNGAGGIHAERGSRIYMYGGEISYCRSTSRKCCGGAVFLDSGAKMYMYGGKMSYNKADSANCLGGGAVMTGADSRFYMYGGELSYNHAKYGAGAAYCSRAYGDTRMEFYGGVICNNTCDTDPEEKAHTIYARNVVLDGTEIKNNTADYAVYIYNNAALKGGSVHDNSGIGVGLSIYEGYSDNIGDIKVYNNRSGNIFLQEKVEELTFGTFNNDTKNGICLNDEKLDKSLGGENGGQYAKHFFSDRDDCRIVNGTDGKLYLKKISEFGADSFITGISSVKIGGAEYRENCTSEISNKTRSVTLHVPTDANVTNLAVTFTAEGVAGSVTSSGSPANGSKQDFTNPVTYTLLNQDGRTEQNWSVEVVKDQVATLRSLTVTDDKGTTATTTAHMIGSEVTATAAEKENKQFISWTADGIELSSEQTVSPTITFTMPSNDVTLTATYKELTSVELTVDEPYGGRAFDAYAAIKLSDGTEGEVPVNWSPMENEADFNSTYTAVVTFTSEYGFSSNLEVTFNGETVTPKKPDSKTLVITKEFKTAKAKLLSVPQAELTGVKNGTALENIVLPSKVRIVTEDKSISTADVVWDKKTATEYNPNKAEEQTFTVDGAIKLPDGIENPNNISLNAKIKVTVSASGIAAVPTSNLVNGAVYNTEQTLELKSADSANIYYTTDGTEPTTSSNKYTDKITLAADSKTDKVYTIKAIAVDASSNKSAVAEFKFTVLAPTYTVTITADDKTAGLGGGKYHEGDVVTVQTASMAKGYVFKGWTATGMELTPTQAASPSFTFTMPKSDVALTPSYLYTIRNIALAIDKPEKNNALDTNAGYTLTRSDNSVITSETQPLTVVWTPADTQAKGNTQYKAIAVLKPNYASGFVFDDSVTATVDGASSTTCSKSDDGSVTVYAVFEATDKVKLASITAPDAMYLNNLTYSSNELMSILPKSVDIKTDDGTTRIAAVYWDISPMRNLFFNYGFGSSVAKDLTGSVTLPDDVDANGIKSTTTITLNKYNVSDSAEIPIPDITPGTYSESKQLNFDIKDDWSKVKEIRYTTDGSEPSATNGTVYSSGTPIELNGTAGESRTITVKVMAVGSSGNKNSAVQAYKYTIDLPAERETVTVTNGIGSGEYNNGYRISIIAQPENGKVFTGWIAEAVTYTEQEVTETIKDENGNDKTETIKKTVRNAEPIANCFDDAAQPVTAFTVPKVEGGEIIEVTAQCADAVTAVNLKADIPSYGGDMPSAMTTSTDGVTVSNFAVTPNDAAAAENTQYTMTVTVCANEGYAFGETPVFTVNGTTAAGNPNTDGTYTVVYTFKTGARERFFGADATGTKSEYHDSNKGDWADSYYAEINTAVFSIPTALKWTVTNNESRTADVPFTAPSVSGTGIVRFGFIITGTEDDLNKVNKVELNVQ